MPSPATIPENKFFAIEDDGDSFQVYLFEGVRQVAGVCVPDDGTGSAFDLAIHIGRLYGSQINAADRIH